MTESEVKAIRDRLAKATPGQWKPGKYWGSIVAEPTPELVSKAGVTSEILDDYAVFQWPGAWGETP